MLLKNSIRLLKTSPLLTPLLALVDGLLYLVDTLAILSAGRVPQKPDTLLILRVDVLGDYLLFRPFLDAIRKSDRYRNHTITLCANVGTRTLAEVFDSPPVDAFIWTDIYKLSTRLLYRFRFVRALRKQGFASVFCSTYSRVLVLDDFLARATGASERVGCHTDFVNIKRWEAWFGNRLYSRLIRSEEGLVFELERNRQITEAFLNQPITTTQLALDHSRATPVTLPEQYIVLSLGAGQDFKIWPTANFAAVARHLRQQYPAHSLVLTGMKNEIVYAEAFKRDFSAHSALLDLTGKLTVPELVYVVDKAALLLANETGVVHIAASTHTPTVVVSQGKALLRWHPYPAPINQYVRYVYPNYIEENRYRLSEIAPSFNPESPCPIDEISVDQVLRRTNELLSRSIDVRA